MAYANAHIVPGDTVLMQTATWSEQVQITVANTTWKAQMGYTPVIDGGITRAYLPTGGCRRRTTMSRAAGMRGWSM